MRRIAIAACLAVILTGLIAGSAVAAGKGKGGGKKSPNLTGSFSLVLVDSTDGVPHWSQHITFDVTTNAQYSFVDVDCYQSGTKVYHQGVGFYTGWPWSRNFTLQSAAWTGGAANCNAVLYSTNADGSNYTQLATTSFDVAA
jgi:hypothetical protein